MVKYLPMAAFALISMNANAIQVIKDGKNDVQITGLAYAGYIYGDQKDSQMYGDNSFVRYGVDAKTIINDDMYAIGRYEAQIKSANVDSESSGTDTRTRYIYGGVSVNDIGQFTFGRQDGSVYANVGKWTDVTYTDGYGGKATGIIPDRFGTRRSSDVLKYEGKFGKSIISASYKLNNNRDEIGTSEAADKNNSAYGLAASYEVVKDLSLGIAYANGDRSDSLNTTTDTVTKYDRNAELYVTGIKFDDKSWYAAFTYSHGKDFVAYNSKHDGYESVIGYNFTNGIGLQATWQKLLITNTLTNDKANGYDAYTIGAKYNFSKNLAVAVEYKLNQLTKNAYSGYKVYEYGSSTNDAVDAGNECQFAVMYKF